MKFEEMERLFRDELEKLDHVPGIELNNEIAWNKINKGINIWRNYSWMGTLGISGVLLIAFLIFRPDHTLHTPVKPIKKNTPILIDSVKSNPVKKFNKQKKSAKISVQIKKSVLISIPDSITEFSVDTATDSNLPSNSDKSDFKNNQLFNRYRLLNQPIQMPPLSFTMPRLSFQSIKVNNSFNPSNFVRSLQSSDESNQNLFYLYEYSDPAPLFYQNSHFEYKRKNILRLTNFNK
jgi:hypothetical protein